MTKEELIIKHNEMVVKIIKECDYVIKNRNYLNNIANFATRIKDIAKFYTEAPKWFNVKSIENKETLLTSENLHDLELHCEKQIRREVGQRVIEHKIVLELIREYKKQQEELKKKDEINVKENVSFDNLKIESNGEITKVLIDDVEQHKVKKIMLCHNAGEVAEFYIDKEARQ